MNIPIGDVCEQSLSLGFYIYMVYCSHCSEVTSSRTALELDRGKMKGDHTVHTVRLFSEVTSSRTAIEHDRGKMKGDHTYAVAALKLIDLLDTLYSHTYILSSLLILNRLKRNNLVYYHMLVSTIRG